jgi:hypothetical protein
MWFTRRRFSKLTGVAALVASNKDLSALAQGTSMPSKSAGLSPDERARVTEAQMTDDERFSLSSASWVQPQLSRAIREFPQT